MFDFRYAVRMLLKNLGFACAVVFTLALGIGATTVIFYWLNAAILKPLPFPDAQNLVLLSEVWQEKGWGRSEVSLGTFSDWQLQSVAVESMAACASVSLQVESKGVTEALRSLQVSTCFLKVLRQSPVLGRDFLPEEGQPGGNHVVILSHELWQQRFGGRSQVIGASMDIEGVPHTVVGVMRESFHFPYNTQIWRPLVFSPDQLARRDQRSLLVIGRLKPNTSLRAAQADLSAIAGRIARSFPQTNRGWDCGIASLRTLFVDGDMKRTFLGLLAAAAFVLLTACANVANLLLARFGSRQKEIAIRSSLGAGQGRIARQLMTESLMLSALGTAAGLLLALWLSSVMKGLIPAYLLGGAQPTFDEHMLLFALGMCVLTCFCFGTVPSWLLARSSPGAILKESSGTAVASAGSRRWCSYWIASEVACAMTLLVGASLMVRTVANLTRVNLGFDPAPLLVAEIDPAWDAKEKDYSARKVLYFQRLREELARTVGVSDAAIMRNSGHLDVAAEGNTQALKVYGFGCSTNIFKTLGVPLVQGSLFPETWKKGDPVEVVVNESFAQRFWPGENAIGKRFKPNEPGAMWITVAGIVRDFRLARDQQAQAQYFTSYRTDYLRDVQFILRTRESTSEAVAPVRQTVQRFDRYLLNPSIRTMGEVLSEIIGPRSQILWLLAGFAAVSLVLAMVGIYGVVTYQVSQRKREVGIRIALGAMPADVMLLIMRQGIKPVLIGIGCGGLGSVILGYFLTHQLFGVRSNDATALLGSVVITLLVGLIACYFPAWRATKIDPMTALHYE